MEHVKSKAIAGDFPIHLWNKNVKTSYFPLFLFGVLCCLFFFKLKKTILKGFDIAIDTTLNV